MPRKATTIEFLRLPFCTVSRGCDVTTSRDLLPRMEISLETNPGADTKAQYTNHSSICMNCVQAVPFDPLLPSVLTLESRCSLNLEVLKVSARENGSASET